jgi:hypothetical protein
MKFNGSISGQIVRLKKLKKLKMVRHVVYIRGMVHTCNISFTNLEGKKIGEYGMNTVTFILK